MALSMELKKLKFPGTTVGAAVLGESHHDGIACSTTSLSCHLTTMSAPLHGTVFVTVNKKKIEIGCVVLRYDRKLDFWISDMYCRYLCRKFTHFFNLSIYI